MENKIEFTESLKLLNGWPISTPYGHGIIRNISIKITRNENQNNMIINSNHVQKVMWLIPGQIQDPLLRKIESHPHPHLVSMIDIDDSEGVIDIDDWEGFDDDT